jgi:hypothetical protein
MQHIVSILWLVSWPILIIVSYKLIVYFLKIMEKKKEE